MTTPDDTSAILRTARRGFDAQDAEILRARRRHTALVFRRTATGTGDVAHTFELDRDYRLVFVRCHFSGNAGTAAMHVSVDSAAGSAYDTRLLTVTGAGKDSDVHVKISADESSEPSPWSFEAADKVRIDWINPDSGNITWGLEVGLSPTS